MVARNACVRHLGTSFLAASRLESTTCSEGPFPAHAYSYGAPTSVARNSCPDSEVRWKDSQEDRANF
ncbi:hypothetical protein V1291_005017 [Nitrobacteraceae bacterium AZCC 1564]